MVILQYIVDEAVSIAHNALFGNMGQSCCAGSRTFVQEGVYDVFVKKAAALASQKKVGNPFDASTQTGPLVRLSKCFIMDTICAK